MENLFIWELLGFTFVSLFGTVLHFLYEWTGSNFFAAVSAVNESTAEHMKLFYFPMLILALVQSLFFKGNSGFWTVKYISLSVGLTLIPVLFYTYNGAIGKSPDVLNIAIFFISAAVSFFVEYRLFKNGAFTRYNTLFFILFIILGALFVIFTFHAPKILLFMDPISRSYGIK